MKTGEVVPQYVAQQLLELDSNTTFYHGRLSDVEAQTWAGVKFLSLADLGFTPAEDFVTDHDVELCSLLSSPEVARILGVTRQGVWWIAHKANKLRVIRYKGYNRDLYVRSEVESYAAYGK